MTEEVEVSPLLQCVSQRVALLVSTMRATVNMQHTHIYSHVYNVHVLAMCDSMSV